MKTRHFVKKYRLNETDQFDHRRFAVDFGHEFQARLELYKTFSNWSHARFMELLDEMKDRWDRIELKTVGFLPEKLWNYIYYTILLPQKDELFPEIAAQEKKIDGMKAKQLKSYLANKLDLGWNKSIVFDAFMEWDRHVANNAVGDLNIRPNYNLKRLEEMVSKSSDYLIHYAFDFLKYQLDRMGHARAKVQFKTHRTHRKRSRFSWTDYIFSQGLDIFSEDEYIPSFELLGIRGDLSKVKESQVQKAYRNLSMKHHPDKGGNAETFVEITEAKNKCMEYFAIKKKK